jgi:hypothetical protein
MAEAALLSIVTLLAAWSGYAAAKWSTESRRPSQKRRRQELRPTEPRARRSASETSTRRLSRPGSPPTRSETRSDAGRRAPLPPRLPGRLRRLAGYESRDEPERAAGADVHAAIPGTESREGEAARRAGGRGSRNRRSTGATADKYVRTTVILASVLFLIGISTHFPIRGIRYALIGLGALLLVFSLIQLVQLDRPPL